MYSGFTVYVGGPGPEILIQVGRFATGILVRLIVAIITEGGQTKDSVVIFRGGGKEYLV